MGGEGEVAEAHGLGVGWEGEEFSGASSMEQEAVSAVHWVSVSGCVMVESYRAERGWGARERVNK